MYNRLVVNANTPVYSCQAATHWFIVYFICKCLSLLCLCFQKYAVSKMRRPLLAALWCVDRKRDTTAVFTNMFSWVNTQDRGTRPRCKQSSSQCHQRGDEEKYFGFIISRVHYSQDVRGVCLRCVAVCLGQFEEGKKSLKDLFHVSFTNSL